MKRIVAILAAAFAITVSAKAQDTTPKDATLAKIEELKEALLPPRYQLFPTKNIYNFIKLDTMTGVMTMVQYGNDKERGEWLLDIGSAFDSANEEWIRGRFTLVATENMYTFILLDTIKGNCWQVQWGFNKEDCAVAPINIVF